MAVVTVERDGAVATVLLDRPEALNVFSGGMGAELSAAYQQCDADPDVRVIVLTGRGRAFCAGADMSPESATFAAPDDAGSHWTLRRIASQAVAADLMLTGRTFRGDEAVALGLASRAPPKVPEPGSSAATRGGPRGQPEALAAEPEG